MHYCHINSTSGRHIDRVLALVGRCQAEGAHVTTEAYPYGSGSTAIGAAFLAPERLRERFRGPTSITYLRTGERVADDARLRELRATDPGGLVIIDFFDESEPADAALLRRSLDVPRRDRRERRACHRCGPTSPTWTSPRGRCRPQAVTHPRTAGTFGRALRLWRAGGRAARWRPSGGPPCSPRRCSRARSRRCDARVGCRPARTPISSCSTRRAVDRPGDVLRLHAPVVRHRPRDRRRDVRGARRRAGARRPSGPASARLAPLTAAAAVPAGAAVGLCDHLACTAWLPLGHASPSAPAPHLDARTGPVRTVRRGCWRVPTPLRGRPSSRTCSAPAATAP